MDRHVVRDGSHGFSLGVLQVHDAAPFLPVEWAGMQRPTQKQAQPRGDDCAARIFINNLAPISDY